MDVDVIQTIKNFISNKNKKIVLSLIITIIIFLLILEQFFRLTLFVINYDYYYNYGKLARFICGSNYFEYETERFQVSNNNFNIAIANDNFNNRYYAIIVALAVIFGIFISIIFAVIIFDVSFNISTFFSVVPLNSAGLTKIFTYGLETTKETSLLSIISSILFNTLKILIILYIILYIPLFVGLKMSNGIDITENYGYISIIFLGFILLILKSGKINPMAGATGISSFIYLIFSIIFICSIYFIKKIIELYDDKTTENNYKNEFENSTNENLRNSAFYYKYGTINKDVPSVSSIFNIKNLITMMQSESDLFKIFKSIFDKVNSFTFVIAIMIIIVIAFIILSIIISYIHKNDYDIFEVLSENDSSFLYSLCIIPIVIMIAVFSVIVITKEYNTDLNNKALYKVLKLYKKDLFDINDTFKGLIINDEITENKISLCKNAANAIYLTLLSKLFASKIDIYKLKIDITPEFIYNTNCDDRLNLYNQLKEYDIEYYLMGKNNNKNIFYDYENCSSINNDMINLIIMNVIGIFGNKQLLPTYVMEIKRSIYNVIVNKNTYNGDYRLDASSDNYEKNNRISALKKDKNIKDDNIEKMTIEYDEIVNNIATVYMSLEYTIFYQIIYFVISLCECNDIILVEKDVMGYINDGKFLELLNNKGKITTNLKKDFVIKITKYITDAFENINELMSNKYEKRNKYILSNFIIKNFNEINLDEKFQRNKLDVISTNTSKNNTKSDDMFKDIKQSLDANTSNINIVFSTYVTNEVLVNSSNYLDNIMLPSDIALPELNINDLLNGLNINTSNIAETFDTTGVNNTTSIPLYIDTSNNTQIDMRSDKFTDRSVIELNNDFMKYKLELISINTKVEDFKNLYEKESYYSSDYKTTIIYNIKNEFIKNQLELETTLYSMIENNLNKIGNNMKNYRDNIDFNDHLNKYIANDIKYQSSIKVFDNILNDNYIKNIKKSVTGRTELNDSLNVSENIYSLLIIYMIIIYTISYVE